MVAWSGHPFLLTGDTMCLKMLTEQYLPPTAVEAFSTKLGVISTHTLADLESLHVLSDSRDDTDRLVAYGGLMLARGARCKEP
jgi:hypothetical protein